MPIIYNGKVLVAHYNPGESPYLLVTFLGAFHEHEAESVYLMRPVVEREKISCVGVTSRVRNLYITDEIEEVAAQVRVLRRPGQTLILLGQSSGGFAAAKFARLFEADYAVSFSPIFSMDESDLGLTESRVYERSILKGAIRFHRVPTEIIRPGMRPGPEDCPVPIIIVYDTGNANDSFAAARYEEILPTAHFVRIRNLGHAVLDRLEDSQSHNLPQLLDHLSRHELSAAQNLVFRLTRNSEASLAELLVQIARWRPAMVPVALRTARMIKYLKADTIRRHYYNKVLAYELVARGDTAAAVTHLHGRNPDLFAEAPPPGTAADSRLFLVLSFHGEFMGYESAEQQVSFSHVTLDGGGRVPVMLDLRGDAPRFVIQASQGDRPVTVDARNVADHGDSFEILPIDGSGLVAFRRGGAFLRADHNSPPVFASAQPQGWERFALLPIHDANIFREKTGMSWFDQVAIGAPAASRPADTVPAPRKTAFRSVLQRFFAG